MFLYTNQHFLQEVQGLTARGGVDAVYDSIGRDTMSDSFKCLKIRGNVVSFGQ